MSDKVMLVTLMRGGEAIHSFAVEKGGRMICQFSMWDYGAIVALLDAAGVEYEEVQAEANKYATALD
jgi:hypothetical protein